MKKFNWFLFEMLFGITAILVTQFVFVSRWDTRTAFSVLFFSLFLIVLIGTGSPLLAENSIKKNVIKDLKAEDERYNREIRAHYEIIQQHDAQIIKTYQEKESIVFKMFQEVIEQTKSDKCFIEKMGYPQRVADAFNRTINHMKQFSSAIDPAKAGDKNKGEQK